MCTCTNIFLLQKLLVEKRYAAALTTNVNVDLVFSKNELNDKRNVISIETNEPGKFDI